MNVRYDGNNKHHSFISSVLNKHLDLVPVCPEVAIGMGVPRAPIQLRILGGELHAVGVGNRAQDVTTALQAYGQQQVTHARAFCGYIFKSRSPSCGVSDTKIFSKNGASAGPGIYTREILNALPWLPVIDEAQLDREETTDNFLERVFTLVRWHQLLTVPMAIKHLMDFHTAHRLTLAGHSDEAYKVLSMMISRLHTPLTHDEIDNYLKQFHDYLKIPLTHKDHVRIHTKLQQHLSPIISNDEAGKLNTAIRKYRGSPESLTMSLQLIKQLADKYNLGDLSRQAYINPTPAEIALRYSQH